MLLAALGATHRLLTTKGPSGVFLYTTSSPMLVFSSLKSRL